MLRDALMSAFPGQLEITGEATPDASGYFEVLVRPAGGGQEDWALLHSKHAGHGHVIGVEDSKEKIQNILDKIRQLL